MYSAVALQPGGDRRGDEQQASGRNARPLAHPVREHGSGRAGRDDEHDRAELRQLGHRYRATTMTTKAP